MIYFEYLFIVCVLVVVSVFLLVFLAYLWEEYGKRLTRINSEYSYFENYYEIRLITLFTIKYLLLVSVYGLMVVKGNFIASGLIALSSLLMVSEVIAIRERDSAYKIKRIYVKY